MGVIKKTFEIELALKQPLTNYEWRVVSGDTGNVLIITLTDGGEPVDLTDARLVMLFSRGTSIAMQTNVYPDTSVRVSGDHNNIITVDLHSGSFAPGFVESYLQISTKSDPDSEEYDVLVTSAKFNFRCDRELFGNEYIMSLDSYSILNELIDEVQEIIHGRIQADWNEDDPNSPQYILNKPSFTSPVQSDWDESSAASLAYIKNKPTSMTPASHTHGNITNDGKIGSTSGRAVYTTTGGALTSGSLATSDPTADGTSTTFIKTASQDGKGKMTLTKANLPTASSSTAGITKVGAASSAASLDANSKVTASEASSRYISFNSNRTLALSDAGCMLSFNSSSDLTVTIPTNASVAFPVGTEIEFLRYNSGAATFAAASGVTIVSVGSAMTIGDRYGCACLKKIDTDTWVLAGDLG